MSWPTGVAYHFDKHHLRASKQLGVAVPQAFRDVSCERLGVVGLTLVASRVARFEPCALAGPSAMQGARLMTTLAATTGFVLPLIFVYQVVLSRLLPPLPCPRGPFGGPYLDDLLFRSSLRPARSLRPPQLWPSQSIRGLSPGVSRGGRLFLDNL